MSTLDHETMKTYIVVPKSGDAVRVRAEQISMSPVHHSIRLYNGSKSHAETVALFHTESILGVIEEDSTLDQPES
jgi:hypothetical protein